MAKNARCVVSTTVRPETMCPRVFLMCPHALKHVSSCFEPCVLMLLTVCPHHGLNHVSIINRYFVKSPNYKYFYNFDFEDYLQRARVVKTYNIRFLKITQGKSRETFGLKDPDEWGLETGEEVVVVNSKAKRAPATTGSASVGWFLLCVIAYVLMYVVMCPYVNMHVSLCFSAYVLTIERT